MIVSAPKPIATKEELVEVCRSAGYWYVGSYMMEFLRWRDVWSNPETKEEFFTHMMKHYSGGDPESGNKTRINCVIRIVQSRMVLEALELVLRANDRKLKFPDAKINAQMCLDLIKNGSLTY